MPLVEMCKDGQLFWWGGNLALHVHLVWHYPGNAECAFSLSLKFFIVTLLQFSQLFPLCPPPPSLPPTPTVIPHTVVHVRGSFIHVLWLVPSPSFLHCPPPTSPDFSYVSLETNFYIKTHTCTFSSGKDSKASVTLPNAPTVQQM